MNLLIREAVSGDREAIGRLTAEVHELHRRARPDVYEPFDPAAFERDFPETLADPQTTYLVAEQDGKPAGMALLTFRQPKNPLLRSRLYAFLEELAVSRNFRGQGIGTRLFREAEQLARDRGAATMELQVWGFNEAARSFYEKMGMTVKSCHMELPFRKERVDG